MTEEERVIYTWFTENIPTRIFDFYETLHIYNLYRMYELAQQGIRHILIPDDWPVDSQWGMELLAASLKGATNSKRMKDQYIEWKNNDCIQGLSTVK